MDSRAVAGLVLGALIALLPPAVAADEARFTEAEIRAILAHGPTFNNPWRPEDHGRCF